MLKIWMSGPHPKLTESESTGVELGQMIVEKVILIHTKFKNAALVDIIILIQTN